MSIAPYEKITNEIIKKLEEGKIPWVKPWHVGGHSFPGMHPMFPAYSYSTGKRYALINQFLTDFTPGEYATFDQIKKAGGHVKKGEHSTVVAGWVVTTKEKKNADGSPMLHDDGTPVVEKQFGLRYYFVFNILTQCEGITPKHDWVKDEATGSVADPDQVAEDIIRGYVSRESTLKFEIVKGSNEAYYRPSTDTVVVPDISQFDSTAEYYSTAFHELVHSTGAAGRCDRKMASKAAAFGSVDYSKEELVAEIGSCFLNSHAGLTTESSFRNSAAYIQNWLGVLKGDPKMIVHASSQAEKATGYILGNN